MERAYLHIEKKSWSVLVEFENLHKPPGVGTADKSMSPRTDLLCNWLFMYTHVHTQRVSQRDQEESVGAISLSENRLKTHR